MNIFENLLSPSGLIVQKITIFFLIIFTVGIFLVFGWFMALSAKKIIVVLFKKVNLDKHFTDSWMEKFLIRGGITQSPTEFLGSFIYWIIIVISIILAAQSLGLEETGDLLDRFLIFLPRAIAFGLILIFGAVFAGFIGKTLQLISGNLGIKEFRIIGRIVQVIIIIYASIMALEQLGVAVFAVAASFNIFWAALCLTLALAVGLGGKELVKNLLEDFVNKLRGKQGFKNSTIRPKRARKRKETRQEEELFNYDQGSNQQGNQ